ncbi:hypothetical protein [Wolbachia endosymbiont (group A) of Tiphia femorata]|nr:hypothetical protein [Wolbachia endosymbiont (group A) of Tiphia femorata]
MLRDTANESRYDVGLLSSQCPDTGMALLHSNRKNLVATDKIHYK